MDDHITKHREGFGFGYTTVTERGEETRDTGITFGVMKLRAGESLAENTQDESAYLLLKGNLELSVGADCHSSTRSSLFDDGPFCLHTPAKTAVSLRAASDVEIAVCRTENTETFPVEWYLPEDVTAENRGAGQVGGTCWRWVRTIFDDTISHPNAQLVLGEVINMPGRWSSYPPHHHVQPEIYHYRFTDPRGFGHAELGDTVLKVKHGDTVKILEEKDHAQCSAPGYGMYYMWVIRHLPNCRYGVPEFTDEHKWTMAQDCSYWQPAEEVTV